MNISDIKLRVKRSFGDESSVQLTDDDILRWTNDAMKEIAQQNDLLETLATTATVVGQSDYVFPADMLTLRAIRYGNRKLEMLTLQQADEFITNYENPTNYIRGTPLNFWVWANTFTLYPTPDTAVAAGIKIFYTRMPATVTGDNDIPEIGPKYHPRIVEYILQQAYEMDEDWEASGNKSAQFIQRLNDLKESDSFVERSAYPTITVMPEDMNDVSGY